MMKHWKILLLSAFLVILSACHSKDSQNEIKVGVISGPEEQLMEVAKQVAKEKYHLNVTIVSFSDYTLPNVALNDGSLDANMFQHLPYLEAQIKAHNYQLVPIGKVFVYPMGLYSSTLSRLSDLPKGAKIAIPNDPSNEARALLLLQKADLIQLKKGADINATVMDIDANPQQFEIVALDAAQLPRALKDVSLSAINTNFAIPAGLSPTKDALLAEGPDSPYANIVVVRAANQNSPQLKNLVEALHSQAVLDKAHQLFGDSAIPAWQIKK